MKVEQTVDQSEATQLEDVLSQILELDPCASENQIIALLEQFLRTNPHVEIRQSLIKYKYSLKEQSANLKQQSYIRLINVMIVQCMEYDVFSDKLSNQVDTWTNTHNELFTPIAEMNLKSLTLFLAQIIASLSVVWPEITTEVIKDLGNVTVDHEAVFLTALSASVLFFLIRPYVPKSETHDFKNHIGVKEHNLHSGIIQADTIQLSAYSESALMLLVFIVFLASSAYIEDENIKFALNLLTPIVTIILAGRQETSFYRKAKKKITQKTTL